MRPVFWPISFQRRWSIHRCSEDRCPREAAVDPLKDPLGGARRTACRALGHLGAEAAYNDLQARAMFDPDDGVRIYAQWALDRVP